MPANRPRHPKLVAREALAIDGMMDISITKLPDRILDELRNAGIHKVEQLNYLSDDELYVALRDIGTRAVDRVRDTLHDLGYRGAVLHDPQETA